MKITLILIILLPSLAACAPAAVPTIAPCLDQARQFLSQSAGIIKEWKNAADNIQPSVLRSLPKKVEDLPIPECARFYKFTILKFMTKLNAGDSTWDKDYAAWLDAGYCLNKDDPDPNAPAACFKQMHPEYY